MLTLLPKEIIEIILCCESLSIADVVRFSLTSQYCYGVVEENNMIWRTKYFQTWPQLSEVLEKNNFNYDWYGEVQYIHNLKQRTRRILYSMPSRLYKQLCTDLDYIEWLELYQEKPQTYHYLVDDLMSIVNTYIPINSPEVAPITTPGNKTLQFYAMETLRFLRKLHLTNEWQSLPQNQWTLEKCAALIMQWCTPNVDVHYNKFAIKLDKITEEIKEYLKTIHPNHPLFAASKEKLKIWRNTKRRGNVYGNVHCLQILDVLEDYCYRSGFSCAIKEFLETMKDQEGVNIILTVVRESVARRLGLKWQPVIVITGYTLQLSQGYNVDDEDINGQDNSLAGDLPDTTIAYVLRRLEISLQPNHYYIEPCRDACIFTRNYLLYSPLLVIFPCNTVILSSLINMYININMDSTALIESLKQKIGEVSNPRMLDYAIRFLTEYQRSRTTSDDNLFKIVRAKVRPPDLKYAVGMVMNCRSSVCLPTDLCVICDWVPFRLIADGQPIYTVLLYSGLYMEVPQDDLKPVADKTDVSRILSLENIGRHFSHVCETHFVPNVEKAMEYPDDAAVRHAYSHKMKADVKLY